ncbi:hypothetical protein [Paenirhodobacter sp.]|uniref:hypothetical protein n=1 Tax=Paenirhodobacter sp. TaxID=1965326 RepID=UPI003B41C43A
MPRQCPDSAERGGGDGGYPRGGCPLHSYANPAHECRIGALLAEHLPGVFVSLSVDVLSEIRDYERTSITVIGSCVGQPVKGYLDSFSSRLVGLPDGTCRISVGWAKIRSRSASA